MADETAAAVTVSLLAFVQSEKLMSSPDAGRDLWVPHPGPHREPDQVIRYAVLAWDVFHQEWRREMDFRAGSRDALCARSAYSAYGEMADRVSGPLLHGGHRRRCRLALCRPQCEERLERTSRFAGECPEASSLTRNGSATTGLRENRGERL